MEGLARLLLQIEKNEKEYEQREILVMKAIALAKELGYAAGVRFDPDDPDWPVWCIDLPLVGEVSWHCPGYKKPYTKYSTEEKYERCRQFRKNVFSKVTFEVGREKSPYISIAHPDHDLENLKDGDEIVEFHDKIRIRYNYPLTNPVIFGHTSQDSVGFTRKELVQIVCNDYKRIYREEEESAGATENIPGMLNRDFSEGCYGIWGHDIDDLVLHSLERVEGDLMSVGVDS